MDVTMFLVRKAESSRTHDNTIDMEFYDAEGKIRIFLSFACAIDLIQKAALAMILPKKGEPDVNVS